MITNGVIYYSVLIVLILSVYLFWFYCYKITKFRFIAFDITVGSILLTLILSRIIGFALHISYYVNQGFSVFPFIQNADGQTKLSSQLPWSFLKFWDGNISLISVVFAILLTHLIVRKSHLNIKLRNEAFFTATLNIWSIWFYIQILFLSVLNDYVFSNKIDLNLLSDENKAALILSAVYLIVLMLLKFVLRLKQLTYLQINWISFVVFIIILISFRASTVDVNFLSFLFLIILITAILTYNFFRQISILTKPSGKK